MTRSAVLQFTSFLQHWSECWLQACCQSHQHDTIDHYRRVSLLSLTSFASGLVHPKLGVPAFLGVHLVPEAGVGRWTPYSSPASKLRFYVNGYQTKTGSVESCLRVSEHISIWNVYTDLHEQALPMPGFSLQLAIVAPEGASHMVLRWMRSNPYAFVGTIANHFD